jgi:hypothetical protein
MLHKNIVCDEFQAHTLSQWRSQHTINGTEFTEPSCTGGKREKQQRSVFVLQHHGDSILHGVVDDVLNLQKTNFDK